MIATYEQVDSAVGFVLMRMEEYAEEHGRELFAQALDELPDACDLARDSIDRRLVGYHEVACLLMRIAEEKEGIALGSPVDDRRAAAGGGGVRGAMTTIEDAVLEAFEQVQRHNPDLALAACESRRREREAMAAAMRHELDWPSDPVLVDEINRAIEALVIGMEIETSE
jgi:hypothetical protein